MGWQKMAGAEQQVSIHRDFTLRTAAPLMLHCTDSHHDGVTRLCLHTDSLRITVPGQWCAQHPFSTGKPQHTARQGKEQRQHAGCSANPPPKGIAMAALGRLTPHKRCTRRRRNCLSLHSQTTPAVTGKRRSIGVRRWTGREQERMQWCIRPILRFDHEAGCVQSHALRADTDQFGGGQLHTRGRKPGCASIRRLGNQLIRRPFSA